MPNAKFEYGLADLDEDMAQFCLKELRTSDDLIRLCQLCTAFYKRLKLKANGKTTNTRKWVCEHPVMKLLTARMRILAHPGEGTVGDDSLAELLCETKIAHRKEVEVVRP